MAPKSIHQVLDHTRQKTKDDNAIFAESLKDYLAKYQIYLLHLWHKLNKSGETDKSGETVAKSEFCNLESTKLVKSS